jgi:Ca-activated chloride channel family protein
VLQLGEDEDATVNLGIIALWGNKKEGALGIANPKSQNSSASKSEKKKNRDKKNKESRDENQPSSGNGGDGEISKEKKREKGKLMSSHKEEKHPLGSKVYELINEGYIYEKQPW